MSNDHTRLLRRVRLGLADIFRMPEAPASPHSPPAGLADSDELPKLVDVGPIPEGGAVQRYWRGRERPHPERLGVDYDARALTHRPWMTDPAAFRERYGLRALEWGASVTDHERREWLYALASSLDLLAELLDVRPVTLGFGGRLTIAVGARGWGGRDAPSAHYEPDTHALNLTRMHGTSALAHELAHAIDHIAGIVVGDDEYLSGGRSHRTRPNMAALQEGDTLRGMMEAIFLRLLWQEDGDTLTAFGTELAGADAYARRRTEVWARTAEKLVSGWVRDRGVHNTFLAPARMPGGSYYPSSAAVRPIDREARTLMRVALERIAAGDAHHPPGAAPGRSGAGRSGPAPTFTRGDATTIETPARSIPAVFAVTELDGLITSHDPRTWKARGDYPAGCQQRDYTQSKAEQAKVLAIARAVNPRFLVSDTPSATDGAPIVTPTRVVLGGNGRTMGLLLTDHYDAYRAHLVKAGPMFGVTAAQIGAYRRPVLVRLVTMDMRECALYSNILNTSKTQQQDVATETVAYARQLTPEDAAAIAGIFEQSGAETIAAALGTRATVVAIVTILRRSGIITAQNQERWLENAGAFSDYGRMLLEGILIGSVLSDTRLITAARSYISALIRALPAAVRLRALPQGWNLVPEIQEAIRLESERRAAGSTKKDFLGQASFDRPEVPARVRLVWDALDAGPMKWKEWLTRYVAAAETESRQGDSFGLTPPQTPEQIMTALSAPARMVRTNARSARHASLSDDIAPAVAQPLEKMMHVRPTPMRGSWMGRLVPGLPDRYVVMVWGLPGTGKSHIGAAAAGDEERRGRVLYVLSEGSLRSGVLQERFRRMHVNPTRTHVLETGSLPEIIAELQAHPYVACIIDSINALDIRPSDVVPMTKLFPHTSFVLITHALDRYQHAGGMKIAHMVDVTAQMVAPGQVKLTKNWFGPLPQKPFKVF